MPDFGIIPLQELEELSVTFEYTWCFDQVKAGKENFDNLYCGGNIVISVLSLVNSVLFAYLLVVHLKFHLA